MNMYMCIQGVAEVHRELMNMCIQGVSEVQGERNEHAYTGRC
jgi:hypothetical protein